jgi:uncharacterized protein
MHTKMAMATLIAVGTTALSLLLTTPATMAQSKSAVTAATGAPAAPGSHGGLGANGKPDFSPPLPVVQGALPWETLAKVEMIKAKDKFIPKFAPEVQKLNNKDVTLVGFMMPLEPGERQNHFLLTITSQTCNFCIPAGPEGMVEIKTKNPLKTTFDAIVVKGKLEVLKDDPTGVLYRMRSANGELIGSK